MGTIVETITDLIIEMIDLISQVQDIVQGEIDLRQEDGIGRQRGGGGIDWCVNCCELFYA